MNVNVNKYLRLVRSVDFVMNFVRERQITLVSRSKYTYYDSACTGRS